MKFIIFVFILLLLSAIALGNDFSDNFDKTYEHASIPNFLPFVGKGLSGRCYQTTGSSQKIATVLMVSFEEDGFDLAPFDVPGKKPDFFDKMSYEAILKMFPVIKSMFKDVSETADGAVLEKNEGGNIFRGEIRESEKYLIMRVFINNKLTKYCNYYK